MYTMGHELGHQFFDPYQGALVKTEATTNQTKCITDTKDWICETRHHESIVEPKPLNLSAMVEYQGNVSVNH